MIIEPAPDLHAAMVQALRDEYMTDQQRPGLHLSEVSYCLTKAYWNRTAPQPPTETEVNLWSIGFALERVMISRMHTPPIVVDGITMTPDFILNGVVADLKSTRIAPTQSDGCAICGEPYRGHNQQTAGHPYERTSRPFDFPIGWQRQFMGYRYGLNQMTCKCGHEKYRHGSLDDDKCYMQDRVDDTEVWKDCDCQEFSPATNVEFAAVVMHVIPAQLTTWRVYFTHNELLANWQWVIERANLLENLLAAQTPEPFQHLGYPGECANCHYQLTCQLTASLEKMKETA